MHANGISPTKQRVIASLTDGRWNTGRHISWGIFVGWCNHHHDNLPSFGGGNCLTMGLVGQVFNFFGLLKQIAIRILWRNCPFKSIKIYMFRVYFRASKVIFPWFSHSNPSKSRALLGHLKWFSMIFPWFFKGIWWFSHDFFRASKVMFTLCSPWFSPLFQLQRPPRCAVEPWSFRPWAAAAAPSAPSAARPRAPCAAPCAARCGAWRRSSTPGTPRRTRRGDVETCWVGKFSKKWRFYEVFMGKIMGFDGKSWGKSWKIYRKTWRFEWIWLMISRDFMEFHGGFKPWKMGILWNSGIWSVKLWNSPMGCYGASQLQWVGLLSR